MNTQFGEASAGTGVDAAHTSTVLGARGGPVEVAWTSALASPSTGFPRLVVNLRPGMPVQPLTMLVPKLAIAAGDDEARVLFGPVQAGVAEAVAACVADGVIDQYDVHHLLLVAAVWVHPAAGDDEAVFDNQRAAARAAIRAGASGGKAVNEVLDAADGGAWNHGFRDRS